MNSPLDMTDSMGPQMYKREPNKRVFVNKSLMFDRVKFVGFDMDYTLAMYKSPEYETLGFELLKDHLLEMGYPRDIADFHYDPNFPIRGLWFDTHHGTLLKVDGFGNILLCVRGFDFLKASDFVKMYPARFVQKEESRFRIFNTLYELPLIYILACLVDFFTNSKEYVQTNRGVKVGDLTMTYESIYNDVLVAMEAVHSKRGPLKTETMKDVDKYVVKDERLPVLLTRLRQQGKQVFLATNSDYLYSNTIMSFMFDTESNTGKKDWMSFFDFIVVDARKPLFFSQGTVVREVNKETGNLHLGTFTGTIQSGAVYSGGSVEIFNEMMGTRRSEVLYVGDHIFGDILKSKKNQGWRTFLVVPEMVQELTVWTQKSHLFEKLSLYDRQIADIYRNLDSSDNTRPDISAIQNNIREVTHEMDQAYGTLGSVFRSGSSQTFFASQVMRYADLYGPSFLNMLYYPLTYAFRAPAMLMPHESTVNHDTSITEDQLREISRAWKNRVTVSDDNKRVQLQRSDSKVPHLYCVQPKELTTVSDDFLEEDAQGSASASSVEDAEP